MTEPKPCAVVFCAGHEKVLAFYRDALGLSVVHSEDSHSVLDASGLQLVCIQYPIRSCARQCRSRAGGTARSS